MIPYKLNSGDKVAIVSLSDGILGEDFVKHEVEIGIKRLKLFGLNPVIMPNSMKGLKYLKEHPEKRKEDLLLAFLDKDIKMIITAIGGDDTYKTVPYLMDDDNFLSAVKNNPKIFIGFSDTTVNHLMFNRIGLSTFYGPAFLVDICELDNNMLPYTEKNFKLFFENTSDYEITSSDIWYLDRDDYSEEKIGTSRTVVKEEHGFEVLNGSGKKCGRLFGGCIESIYDLLTGERYGDENEISDKYNLIPTSEEFNEKILFLETSQEKPTPKKLEIMLKELKNREILSNVEGIIVGKPCDEVYYEEYKEIYRKVFHDLNTPVLYNVNFGHSHPRCVIPYDALCEVDYDNKKIKVKSKILK